MCGSGSGGGEGSTGGAGSGGGEESTGGAESRILDSNMMRSPEIRPFPKAPPRKTTTNRQQGKSRILTKTPIKTALDAELVARAQKKSAKARPKKSNVLSKSSEVEMVPDHSPEPATRMATPKQAAISKSRPRSSSSKIIKLADVMKALF